MAKKVKIEMSKKATRIEIDALMADFLKKGGKVTFAPKRRMALKRKFKGAKKQRRSH